MSDIIKNIAINIFIVLILFACSVERNWKNPLDPNNTLADSSWMPSDFKLKQLDIHTVKLTWLQNDQRIDGFRIDKKAGSNNWLNGYKIINKNQREFIDSSLIPNSINTYRLCAIAASNLSTAIEEYINSDFPPPDNVQIKHLDDYISLSWEDISLGEDGYKIDKRINNNDWIVEYSILPENTEIFIDSSHNSGINEYKIYGYYSNYCSDPCNSITYLPSENNIVVPHEYLKIQDAIDSALNGDTIVVYPGIYFESLKIDAKKVIICSLYPFINDDYYIDETIIDGENLRRIAEYTNGVNNNSILCGFTIRNGYAVGGSGILCFSSSPYLTDLKISNNYASNSGAGLLCYVNANPIIQNVTINDNTAEEWGGGLMCYDNSSPIFRNLSIKNNYSGRGGGGVYIEQNCEVSFYKSTINNNSSPFGAGIFCQYDSKLNIKNLIISNNISENSGSSIYLQNSSDLKMINCTISSNTCDGNSLYFVNNCKTEIINSILWNNIMAFQVLDFIHIKIQVKLLSNILILCMVRIG